LKEWSQIPGFGNVQLTSNIDSGIISLLKAPITKSPFEEEIMAQNLEMLQLRELDG
jgi:hypothetical protein